jgi:Spy/CpxP family protein refolding chaperone
MRLFVPQPVGRLRTLLLAAAVASLAISAGAQGRGPGGKDGKEGFGAHGGMVGDNPRLRPRPSAGENTGGLELGPPARWWDNKEYVRTIGITSIQQRRMDDVFAANRDNLTRLYKNLQHEQSQLKKLTRSQTVDENLIYQQIDRVAMARGELEKGYAHMTLQIRKEMTPEQTAKLDDLNAPQQ